MMLRGRGGSDLVVVCGGLVFTLVLLEEGVTLRLMGIIFMGLSSGLSEFSSDRARSSEMSEVGDKGLSFLETRANLLCMIGVHSSGSL